MSYGGKVVSTRHDKENMNYLQRFWDYLMDLFNGEDSPDEPLYDPVHIAGVVVVSIAALGILFWLLWALFVCEGGIFVKIMPFLKVVFTSKTLQDFGYEGYPYELGIFEGWIVNLAALVLTLAAIVSLWWIDRKCEVRGPRDEVKTKAENLKA